MIAETQHIPFPTSPSDWFFGMYPDEKETVFIEHPLIIQVMKIKGFDVIEYPEPIGSIPGWARNFSEEYRNYAISIGRSVVRWIGMTKPVRYHGEAYSLALKDISFHCAFFNGETYVFVPRKE